MPREGETRSVRGVVCIGIHVWGAVGPAPDGNCHGHNYSKETPARQEIKTEISECCSLTAARAGAEAEPHAHVPYPYERPCAKQGGRSSMPHLPGV